MKVVWSDAAMQNRDHILTIISEDNPRAAVKLDQSFEHAAHGLLVFPLKGRQGRKPDTRELIVHPNYIIVYTQAGENILVLTVLHAAQRWP